MTLHYTDARLQIDSMLNETRAMQLVADAMKVQSSELVQRSEALLTASQIHDTQAVTRVLRDAA